MCFDQPCKYGVDEFLQTSATFIQGILRADFDWPEIIEGEEGSGKSSFELARCHSIDPTFDVDTLPERVAWQASAFEKIAMTAPKYSAIMHDEAVEGFYGRQALGFVNVGMQKLFKKFRKRNLYAGLILPDITDFDAKFRRRRPKSAIRIVTVLDPQRKKWLRGVYEFYSREKLRRWYRDDRGDLHRPEPSKIGLFKDIKNTPLYQLYKKLADENQNVIEKQENKKDALKLKKEERLKKLEAETP